MERKLNEVWKEKEGGKTIWYVQAPKGRLNFTTKKAATRWAAASEKMLQEPIWVSGSNGFNEKDFNKMVELLDSGNKIQVGISCIGHTRNNMEQENYKKAFEEHYGNRLEVSLDALVNTYSYTYYLK